MRNGFQKMAGLSAWLACAAVAFFASVFASGQTADAQPSGCKIDIALLGADSEPGRLAEMAAAIDDDERINSVATIQIDSTTPTLTELLTYDAVLVWTNDRVKDNAALGDTLADYVDLGGGVVVGMLAFTESDPAYSIGGRFFSENFYCISRLPNTRVRGIANLGIVLDPAHPIVENVLTFGGGTTAFRSIAPLHPDATPIANWDTGETLVAVREDLEGKRVDLGFWPVSNESSSAGWDATTDGWQLIANALYFVSPCSGANGFALCEGPIASSAVPDPDIGCVKIQSGMNNQMEWDVAVPFSTGTGGEISKVTFWGIYDETEPPTSQNFRVEFFRYERYQDPSLTVVHKAWASTSPIKTGINQTSSGSPVPIYEFQLVLDPPLIAEPNQSLYMSIMPEGETSAMCWQLADTAGSHQRVLGNGTIASQPGTLAYAICRPDGAVGCFEFGDTSQEFSGSHRFRGLGFSFLFDERLTEISAMLNLTEPTELHWLVYEAETLEGEYSPIHETISMVDQSGNAEAKYSSGPIEVPIRSDRYYLIGFAWDNERVSHYMKSVYTTIGIPHDWPMGEMEFVYGINNFQFPATDPIVFDPDRLDRKSEYHIQLCFGGEPSCVCDLFDTSSGMGVCDVFDILGFQTALGNGDPSACDLDTSTGPGVCDVFDFLVFQTAYTEGCK